MREREDLPKELWQILQQNPPELSQRREFAEKVMEQIQHLPPFRRFSRKYMLYRWISSSAAVFLLGWFLWQTLWFREPMSEYPNAGMHIVFPAKQQQLCVEAEETEDAWKQYVFCYMQTRKKKNKSMEQQLINHYRYEKK